MKRFRRLLVLLLVSLALPTALLSQSPEGERRIVSEWHEELARAQQHLLDGRWRRAYGISQRVSGALTHLVEGGEGAAHFLAQAAAIQALAEAGMGRERDAAWSWSTAVQLYPHLRNVRLEAFGEAGEYLAGIDVPPPCEPGDDDCGRTPDPPRDDPRGEILPPRKIHTPHPVFPRAQLARIEAPVQLVVLVIIDTEGKVHSPRILRAEGEPTFIASALTAMRDWRFKPARWTDGTPAEAFYNLTINYTHGGLE